MPRKMFVATAAVKGLTGLGWALLLAVDEHVVRCHLSADVHNDILGVLIVTSIGIVAHWKRTGSGGTYSQGVVDGMRLAAGDADLPTPRRSRGANVLYLHDARNGGAYTQRAPKPAATGSSS